MNFRAYSHILLLALVISACSTSSGDDRAARDLDQVATEQVAQEPTGEACGALFEDRLDAEKTAEAIECWESALRETKTPARRAEFHSSLAGAHYFMARYHYFVADTADEDTIAATAQLGADQALNALEILTPDLNRLIERDQSLADVLTDEHLVAADALLHYARNLDLLVAVTSVASSVAHRPTIDAVMNFIADHRPEAHYGAAYRYLGARWVKRPFHKSPENSARAFEKSLSIAPHFFITRVLRARYFAVATDDRELFETDLRFVLDADPAGLAENHFAQRLAQNLLDRADELF